MIDIYGREFLESEFNEIVAQGVVKRDDATTVMGVENGCCHRCLNQSQADFGSFNYDSGKIIYCRVCIDFGLVTNKTVLYRLPHRPEISPESSVLNKGFQLSFLQERASNFSQDILKNNETGLVWAVCVAHH